MKPVITRFILLFLMGVYTPTIMAVPFVAIDFDSGTAGIQSSLFVLSGAVVNASLVAYDDSIAPTSVLIVGVGADEITSSSVGVASFLGSTATAGSFADFLTTPIDTVASIFAFPSVVAVASGDTLMPFTATSTDLGSVAYSDLAGLGASLPIGLGSLIDLINFSFTAGSVGSSIISASGSLTGPSSSGVPTPTFSYSTTASLTVISAGGSNNIPEPSILFLMTLGLLGFSARHFFSSAKV